ncbi:aerolysin-like protein [Mercenaria mercenaria]|uniref:aerolysin-like protein n=1 Tax=Mercenaria mercenaria TaxID=6596 RepID=UPI00234E4A80|nr:aerolysin-like protein [Mercenaria mercenaria]
MPHIVVDKSVDLDYFTDNNASGGDGGNHFHFIKKDDGAILTKIKAWKRDWRISAVEVWMSDGSSFLAGKRAGENSEFKFRPGEVIAKLNVQASGPYSSVLHRRRLGAIYIQTNKQREWGIYCHGIKKEDDYWPDVGSGICCGMFGGAGDAVDRLGFAMLRPIKSSILCNVTYPRLASDIVATKPDMVAHQIFRNGSGTEQSFTLSGSRSVTIQREWSMSTEMSMTLSIEVEAGIPIVGSVTTSTSWTVSSTSTRKVSKTTTKTHTYTWPLKCPPYTSILGEATMYADDIDTPYEGEVKITLINEKSYTYKVKGTYKGMNARSGIVTIKRLGPYPSKESSEEEDMYQIWSW